MPQKIIVHVTDEMHDALKRQHEQTGVPMSEIVRRSIARELRRMGEKKIEWKVSWGGYRDQADEKVDDQGQTVAYTAR